MTSDVFVPATAATAAAATSTPRVSVKTGMLAARAMASASAPTVIIAGPLAVLSYVVSEPDYHLPADHHDPIALGTEIGLVLVFVFVGWKFVACRLLTPSPSE